MTPSRCSHPCAPRSASSVYCLLTIPLLRLGLLDPLTGSTGIASSEVETTRYTTFCSPASAESKQHNFSAHSSCTVPWRCRQQAPHRAANMPKKVRTETKSGPTEHHQQRGFCKKTGRDMSEGGVTTGKKRSTATKTCWRRKMALTAAQTMAGSSLSPKNRLFLPT